MFILQNIKGFVSMDSRGLLFLDGSAWLDKLFHGQKPLSEVGSCYFHTVSASKAGWFENRRGALQTWNSRVTIWFLHVFTLIFNGCVLIYVF